MFGFVQRRLHSLLAAYLIITVSSIFLFVALESLRSSEIDLCSPISEAYYTSFIAAVDCVLVQARIEKNSFFSLRFSVRLLVIFGLSTIMTAFSKSFLHRNEESNPFNTKNSILLKLRI